MVDKHKDLLKKLRELSMRGVDGEKENAQKLFDKLSKKYGICEGELNDECINVHKFKYHGEYEERLLVQVIVKVLNKVPDFYSYTNNLTGRKKRTVLGAKCTEAQRIEINFLFDFYNELYKKEMEYFYSAFIQKHRIFRDIEDDEEIPQSTFSDEELRKISMLADVSLYTCDTAKRTESIIDYNKVTVVSEKTSREYAVVYKTDKGTYQINPDTLNKRSVIFEVSEEPTQVEIEERKSFDMCFFIEVTDVTYTFTN